MAIELLRIDERLIHGQVVVGWGARLGIQRYIVVDDVLAEVAWEQQIYASALPPDVDGEFLAVAEARDAFPRLDEDPRRTALLTRGTAEMRALGDAGLLEGRRVNVGGVHGAEGRTRYLDFVFLSPREVEDLRALAAAGARVAARDLPTSTAVSLDDLLEP